MADEKSPDHTPEEQAKRRAKKFVKRVGLVLLGLFILAAIFGEKKEKQEQDTRPAQSLWESAKRDALAEIDTSTPRGQHQHRVMSAYFDSVQGAVVTCYTDQQTGYFAQHSAVSEIPPDEKIKMFSMCLRSVQAAIQDALKK